MKKLCGQAWGEIPSVRCDNTEGNHPLCTGFSESHNDYVDWVNPNYQEPKKVDPKAAQSQMREMAARVAPARSVKDGFAAGLEASQKATGRWTQAEKDRVFEAIKAVAREHDEFTTDLIWERLDGSVPVTKGMTAMLKLAERRNILLSTGKTEISRRGGSHDHGQRLTVWCSLIGKT